jgi:thiamine biosynthesis lipoprotein
VSLAGRPWSAAILLVPALVFELPAVSHAARAHQAQVVMGTVLQVTVVGDDDDAARSVAGRVVAIARHWDDVLTTWRDDGELAKLNAHAGRGVTPISNDLRRALASMLALARATNGAFDPAVAPFVDAWRGNGSNGDGHGEAAHVERHRILDDLLLGPDGAVLAAGAALDAGGIGKGIAVDAAMKAIAAAGVRGALLDFGGSSQAAVGNDGEHPWRVAVAGRQAGVIHGYVELSGRALSTSRTVPAGDPAGSIIDPRTGKPVSEARLVTVIAPDATKAEAWSTALVVLGRDGLEAARAAGLEVLIDDASGVTKTPGFPLHPLFQ